MIEEISKTDFSIIFETLTQVIILCMPVILTFITFKLGWNLIKNFTFNDDNLDNKKLKDISKWQHKILVHDMEKDEEGNIIDSYSYHGKTINKDEYYDRQDMFENNWSQNDLEGYRNQKRDKFKEIMAEYDLEEYKDI